MKWLVLFIVVFLSGFQSLTAQQHPLHQFEIKDGSFMYDGKPITIHSGEMHFARVPREYWRHRLQMIKAMGLNTVATYVFWNYHETAPGKWDFKSESRNIREFIKLAQEEGLFVILRPGPYACAEWEFGGYPWWLQLNKDLEIRTYNQPFLDSCKVYLGKLAEQVKDLEVSKGGPIIMVQVENEFGSYVAQRRDIPLAQHKKYNQAIRNILVESGFTGPFFTSDGSSLFSGGAIDSILPSANGEDNIAKLKTVVNQYHHNQGPYMVAEFYPGWLDHWGEAFEKVTTASVVKQSEQYLQNNISFSFYMVHGGTNFGYTSGANYNKAHLIQPDITSYDYDAPISEAGWVTEKYNAIRDLMKKYSKDIIPEPPKQIPVISLPAIPMEKAYSVLDWKNSIEPVVNEAPMSFEGLNQGNGYVLYSRKFVQPVAGTLKINGLRDYATVYVNGEYAGTLNRQSNKFEMNIDIPFNATLDILVENMGRINYGAEIVHNQKGIISPVFIDSNAITGNWKMYSMPLETVPVLGHLSSQNTKGVASFYTAFFNLDKTGDTFLDMHDWGKGIVFINGHHLGRYWNKGPQQTLYLPGVWLKKGRNEIFIFEQKNDNLHPVISGKTAPVLDELVLDNN